MTTLVTGATGNIGRRIVDQLIERGVEDIRALTVNPAKANLPAEVTAITGFLGKPETLPAAFDGVDRVYLAPYTETLATTLDLLRAAEVSYVVALSGGKHWQEHADMVAASGMPHTQLGPGEFAENFADWGPLIAAGQPIREPYPNATLPPIAMDDIARVAATLLTGPAEPHLGKMYELTGPEALSRPEVAARIAEGAGVSVTYEKCGRAEAEERLTSTMGEYAGWYLDLMQVNENNPQPANSLVEDLTGTPAIGMVDWAHRHANLFR